MTEFARQPRKQDGPAASAARASQAGDGGATLQHAEERPAAVTHRALQAALGHSPRLQSQLLLGRALNESPRAAAQAKLAEDLSQRGRTPPGPITQRQPAPSDGVVQRQIKIGEGEAVKDYTVDAAMSAIFQANLIKDMDLADAVADQLTKYHKEKRSFKSIREMFEAALHDVTTAEPVEEADVDESELNFPMGYWQDEPDKMRKTNLKQLGYVKGESLRATQGMDYKSVDKDAYEVKGKPELALVIRLKRPPQSGSITQEANTLKGLKEGGLASAKVYTTGYYPVGGDALPAMLMKRYVTSSKTIVRRVKDVVKATEGWKQNIQVFDTTEKVANGIKSLDAIAHRLRSKRKLAVNDIQFLVDDNGEFFINDADEMNEKYLQANVEVIDELKVRLKQWGKVLAAQELKRQTESDSEEEQDDDDEPFIDPYIPLPGGYYLPNPYAGNLGVETEGSLTDFFESRTLMKK